MSGVALWSRAGSRVGLCGKGTGRARGTTAAADGAAAAAAACARANRRYNKHTYKFSGLANLNKTLDIGAEGNSVTISKSSTRKPSKLAKSLVNKCARRTNYAAGAEAKSMRPDLKVRPLAGCFQQEGKAGQGSHVVGLK